MGCRRGDQQAGATAVQQVAEENEAGQAVEYAPAAAAGCLGQLPCFCCHSAAGGRPSFAGMSKVAATSLLQRRAGEAPTKTPGKDTKQPCEAKQLSLRELNHATGPARVRQLHFLWPGFYIPPPPDTAGCPKQQS